MAKKKPTAKKPAAKKGVAKKKPAKKTEMVQCEACSEHFDAIEHHRVCCESCAKLLCPSCRQDCGACGLTYCDNHAAGSHDCPEDVEEEEIIEEDDPEEEEEEEDDDEEEDDEVGEG